VTALAMVGDREKVLGAGFDGYIAKPIVPETFVTEVETFLDKSLHSEPRAEAEPASESAVDDAACAKHGVLLVVDDSDIELGLLHSMFDPSGYEVIKASNLAHALELARKLDPDLIVSDVNMPGGSGFELLEAVKNDPELRHIPVILITSTALSESERRHGLECGAVRYIMRPIEPQALISQVEACLQPRAKMTIADILLVDDVPANSEVVRSILEPSGYTVRVAFSAAEAVSLARERTPDLLLTDMHMPGEGGIALVRVFRTDPSLHRVQIAVSSASLASSQEQADARELGVTSYISRPIEPAILLAEIEALLKSEKTT
jgi:CheY-like chemotaxis protein